MSFLNCEFLYYCKCCETHLVQLCCFTTRFSAHPDRSPSQQLGHPKTVSVRNLNNHHLRHQNICLSDIIRMSERGKYQFVRRYTLESDSCLFVCLFDDSRANNTYESKCIYCSYHIIVSLLIKWTLLLSLT